MKNKIDQVFINSEHQKDLHIRPELRDRLERRLDEDRPGQSRLPRWFVAASIAVIVTLSGLLYLNIDRYELEDLSVKAAPNFSKEEIADLEQVYWIPQSIFVNPEV